MTHKARKNYTKRPLNDAEREFAASPENHNMIFQYMKYKGLDAEIFYDELIFDYLTAVKKYVTERPDLQIKYTFKQVLFQQLKGRMMHYWREYYNKKNTLNREAFRLDHEYENHKQDGHSRIEMWWIDPMQNLEKQILEKEFLMDIYSNVHRYAEGDLLKLVIDMRQEGWSDYSIAKKAAIELVEDYEGCSIKEIADLIRLLTRSKLCKSPFQRLYRDTMEYGNYEKFCAWEDAMKEAEYQREELAILNQKNKKSTWNIGSIF